MIVTMEVKDMVSACWKWSMGTVFVIWGGYEWVVVANSGKVVTIFRVSEEGGGADGLPFFCLLPAIRMRRAIDYAFPPLLPQRIHLGVVLTLLFGELFDVGPPFLAPHFGRSLLFFTHSRLDLSFF